MTGKQRLDEEGGSGGDYGGGCGSGGGSIKFSNVISMLPYI